MLIRRSGCSEGRRFTRLGRGQESKNHPALVLHATKREADRVFFSDDVTMDIDN